MVENPLDRNAEWFISYVDAAKRLSFSEAFNFSPLSRAALGDLASACLFTQVLPIRGIQGKSPLTKSE